MNKKILTLLLVSSFIVSALSGCANTGSNTDTNKPGVETETSTDTNDTTIGDSENSENIENSEIIGTDTENNTEVANPTESEDSTESEISTETETKEPHVHAYTDAVTTEPTCIKTGVKTFTCECGDTYTEEIKATGHSYGEYLYNNDATTSKDGTKTATCSKCGKEDTKTASGTKLNYTYTQLSVEMLVVDDVNVRNAPSTDGAKIGKLSAGEIVFVYAKCNETGWYQIDYDTGYGYVSSKYLVADGQTVGNVEYINGFVLDHSDPFGGVANDAIKNNHREAARATYYEVFEFQNCDGIGITFPCEQMWYSGKNPETGEAYRVWCEDYDGTLKNESKAFDIIEAYADNFYGAGNYKYAVSNEIFAYEYENGEKVPVARFYKIVPKN